MQKEFMEYQYELKKIVTVKTFICNTSSHRRGIYLVIRHLVIYVVRWKYLLKNCFPDIYSQDTVNFFNLILTTTNPLSLHPST